MRKASAQPDALWHCLKQKERVLESSWRRGIPWNPMESISKFDVTHTVDLEPFTSETSKIYQTACSSVSDASCDDSLPREVTVESTTVLIFAHSTRSGKGSLVKRHGASEMAKH